MRESIHDWPFTMLSEHSFRLQNPIGRMMTENGDRSIMAKKLILPKARHKHPRCLESVILVRTGRHPHRAVRALQPRCLATILLSNEKVQRNVSKSRYVMRSPVDKHERLDWIAVGGDLASETFSGVAAFSLVERLLRILLTHF